MSKDTNKFHFRLVLLGSNETGKTSILNRFLFKKFETKYKPTVEDLFSQDYDLGNIEIKVDFLDTTGSMQFPAMRRLSISTGDAFLIVYALDDENSYEVVKMTMAEIQEIRPDFQKIPIVFAGNKSDLPKEARKVPKEVVSYYVHYELPRLQAKVIECSCKDDVNIDNIFRAYLSLARVTLSTNVATDNDNSSGGGSKNATTANGGTKNSSIWGSASNSFSFSGTIKRASSALPGVIGSWADNSDSRASSRCESPRELDDGKESSCGTSIKLALGVRKSCDASIVSSMRKVSLSNNSARNSREHILESMNESDRSNSPASGSGGGGDEPQIEQKQPKISDQNQDFYPDNNKDNFKAGNYEQQSAMSRRLAPKSSVESILMDAIQQQNSNSKLGSHNRSMGGRSKPRSRSLIWRPHSKSSRSSAANKGSDCRVS